MLLRLILYSGGSTGLDLRGADVRGPRFPYRVAVATPVERPSVLGMPPWAVDMLITATILACTAMYGLLNYRQHPQVPGVAVAALTTLPLLVRSRWPIPVLGVVMTGTLVYYSLGYHHGPIALAGMVALFTVATTGDRLRSLQFGIAVSAAVVGVKAAIKPATLTDGSALGQVAWVTVALLAGEAVRHKRALFAELVERAQRAEQTREEEARSRVAAERMRIARELHDVVAHGIAMINVQAGVAAHVIDSQPDQAKTALLHIKDASKTALAELRTTLGLLRQEGETEVPIEPAPGLGQLDALVAAARRTGLSVTVKGEVRPLPPALDLAAYRIAQEALTNVVKHAGATLATVTLTHTDARVVLEVADDGVGVAAPFDSGGHGLVGMRERAAAVGGRLVAGPADAGGFLVQAELPLVEVS
jgi:signal transduction histidine kinase